MSKASANFTQSCRKWERRFWSASRLGRTSTASPLGAGPLGCVTSEALFYSGPVDDDEIRTTYYASHVDMDEAFCARMRIAIDAGLESAPIGVITTPGTKNPK